MSEGNASLQERLRASREALQKQRTFVLGVQGHVHAGLHARYRVLPYEELRRIGQRNPGLTGTPEGEVMVAALTIANSCLEVLDKNPDTGELTSVGNGWNPEVVRELFPDADLPEHATSLNAIHEVFSGPDGQTNLMMHWQDYNEKVAEVVPEIDEVIRGN
jgi:hypothetical protein